MSADREWQETFEGRWSMDVSDSIRQAAQLDLDPEVREAIKGWLIAANELIQIPGTGVELRDHPAIVSALSWAGRARGALVQHTDERTSVCGIHGETVHSGRCPSCDREAITSARTALAAALGYEVDEHGRAIAPPLADLVSIAVETIVVAKQDRDDRCDYCSKSLSACPYNGLRHEPDDEPELFPAADGET